MKKLILLLLLVAPSSWALTPDFNVYLRAGSGSNLSGGGQECISNKGSGGNEFRLGNECGIYGEFSFGAYVLKPESETAPFWRFFTNFAVVYNNQTDFEAPNTQNWVLREVYTEGGRVDGLDFYVWAGKRFYRWGDVHMMDFYPVNFSGPGGGIGGMKVGSGVMSIAFIQNSKSDEINGATSKVTTVGNAAKTSLHVRWDDIETASLGKWSAWLAGGTTPSAHDTTTTTDYKSASGGFLAVKNNWALLGGNNELGVAYGSGVMSNMGAAGELVKDCSLDTDASCTVTSSNRIRAWENYTLETTGWSMQAALIYDEANSGTSANSKVKWTSIGVRPVKWFTDHISVAFQAGLSTVNDEADGLGNRTLSRFTVAPQLSLGKGFYSRPVIRAYYSRTQWNDANKVSAASTSAKNTTSLDSLGMQTEIWF